MTEQYTRQVVFKDIRIGQTFKTKTDSRFIWIKVMPQTNSGHNARKVLLGFTEYGDFAITDQVYVITHR